MKISNNIPALKSLHSLNVTNSSLDKVLERLSTGKRINRAADDAAGLAIAQKMDTQVRGLGIAQRNSTDGISLIQTAEGALTEVHAMLQRMRELCIQASNGTLATDDRKALNNEVTQLRNEIGRIAETTEFNEMKLLNGDIDRRAFSDDSDIASVVAMSDSVEPGVYKFEVDQEATRTILAGDTDSVDGLFDATGKAIIGGTVNINGEQTTIKVGETTEEVFAKLRNLCNITEIDIVSTGPFGEDAELTLTSRKFGPTPISITGDAALLNSLGIGSTPAPTYTLGENVQVLASSMTGFPVGTTFSTKGDKITFEGPRDFSLTLQGGGTPGEVEINVLATGPLDLQIGANEGQFMEIRIQNLSPEALGIEAINLSTSDSAQESILIIDNAINTVSSVRSKLGAFQNRLEHTVKSLSVAAENMTASLSSIEDADMAMEMSEYTKLNVLAQAGTSMLAQANQRPQSILQLLNNQ